MDKRRLDNHCVRKHLDRKRLRTIQPSQKIASGFTQGVPQEKRDISCRQDCKRSASVSFGYAIQTKDLVDPTRGQDISILCETPDTYLKFQGNGIFIEKPVFDILWQGVCDRSDYWFTPRCTPNMKHVWNIREHSRKRRGVANGTPLAGKAKDRAMALEKDVVVARTSGSLHNSKKSRKEL